MPSAFEYVCTIIYDTLCKWNAAIASCFKPCYSKVYDVDVLLYTRIYSTIRVCVSIYFPHVVYADVRLYVHVVSTASKVIMVVT